MARVRTYLSVKSLGSTRAQAPTLSWIVDVYIQIPWPHRVTRSNLDLSFSSSSARVDYHSLSYACDLYLCNTAILLYLVCLRHTSRDERAQALCANFVLQATNAHSSLALRNSRRGPGCCKYTLRPFLVSQHPKFTEDRLAKH